MADQIKSSAKFLREELQSDGIELGSSHSHAIVAAALGFKSKKALIDSPDSPMNWDFDEYPSLALCVDDNRDQISDAIGKIREQVPIKEVDPSLLARIIQSGLTPACESCNSRSRFMFPVGYEIEITGWACQDCADSSLYSHCGFCGEGTLHAVSNLNEAGECPVHAGESSYSDEELEDLESLAEYIANH